MPSTFIWVVVAVAAALVGTIVMVVRLLRPSAARIERALRQSHATRSWIRQLLVRFQTERTPAYADAMLAPSVLLTQNIRAAIDRLLTLETSKVAVLVRVCNHRVFVLSLKRGMKQAADAIAADFARVVGSLELDFQLEDRLANLTWISACLAPSLQPYEEALKRLPPIEKRLMESANELAKVGNPGFFRRIGYLFSGGLEERDRARRSAILQDWRHCAEVWKAIAELHGEVRRQAEQRLYSYTLRLLVFTPHEAITKRVMRRAKRPSERLVPRLQQVVAA